MDARNKRPASAWISVLVVVAALLTWGVVRRDRAPGDEATADGPSAGAARLPDDPGARAVEQAFRARSSGVAVEVSGVVKSVLPDEREGFGLQRFVLELEGGRSLLVEHDLGYAPRVPLEVGQRVELAGVYEWSNRGGVVRGTHRGSEDAPVGGWIRLAGERYR